MNPNNDSPSDSLVDWCIDRLTLDVQTESRGQSDLSQLSVVIPSLGRSEFLLRQIVYWSPMNAQVFLVDGSRTPLPSRILSVLESHTNIHYVHNNASYLTRLKNIADYLTTPYTVLVGDDEFQLPTGLHASIRTLDSDPNIAASLGQCLLFRIIGRDHRLVYTRMYPSHGAYDIRDPNYTDRLSAAFQSFNSATYYAVLRTSIWRHAWADNHEWSAHIASEIQQALVVYLLGEVTAETGLSWLRSTENPRYVTSNDGFREVSFSDWWLHSSSSTHDDYCDAIASVVADSLNDSTETISSNVRDALELHLTDSLFGNPWYGSISSRLRQIGEVAQHILTPLLNRMPDGLIRIGFSGIGWLQTILGISSRGRWYGRYYGTRPESPEGWQSLASDLSISEDTWLELVRIESLVQEFIEHR